MSTSTRTVTIRIPTPLRKFTGGARQVEASGATVGAVLDDLFTRHGQLRGTLLDASGDLRSFVNIYVGQTNARSEGGLQAPVGPGATLSIVPAVAGGAR